MQLGWWVVHWFHRFDGAGTPRCLLGKIHVGLGWTCELGHLDWIELLFAVFHGLLRR